MITPRAISVFLVVSALSRAQTVDNRLTFDVASVKPAPPDDGRGM
jgi:hypothetical protein